MKSLAHYLRPYVPTMSVGLVIKFIGTIMDLLLPWALAHLIDDVVPAGSVPLVLLWGGLMMAFAGVALLTNVVANRMASRVARDTTRTLRHDLFDRIAHLSCQQIDATTIPSLEARLTTDTYNIQRLVGMMQRMGIRAPILLVGGIAVTLSLDVPLTLVLLAVLPLLAVVVVSISRRGIPLYRKLQQAVDALVRKVREDITGIRVIKALSKVDFERQRFADVNAHLSKSEAHAGTVMAASNPLMNLFLNIGLVLVIVVGAYRVGAGLSQTGTIIAFLSYFTIILNAMMMITRMFVIFTQGSASAARIQEVLQMQPDLAVRPNVGANVDESAHIVFEHVSFSYDGVQENLADVSFALGRGQTLGVIGPIGSGKSTLLQLLIRFYDVSKGSIRIGGRELSSIPFEELYTMFGVVFQNDVVFSQSLGDNVAFGRNLSEQGLLSALEDAQAGEFVRGLADGLSYEVSSRGTNISGGQGQRLLIARALAAHPDILLLDDCSSALDYKTDAQLRTALREGYQGTTTVIVAQRISSILHADHILVLDEGQIIGAGTHEQLLEHCEAYREIFESQMGEVL